MNAIRVLALPLLSLLLLGWREPLSVQGVDQATLTEILHDMPKTEIHTHIEGAVRPETILELAPDYQVTLPANTVDGLKSHIQMRPGETLLDFLKKFDCFRFVFDHPESLRRISYELVEDTARENVIYTELRINPIKHPELLSVDGVLDAVIEGMDQACRDLQVEAGLIVSINRSYSVESAMQVAQAAVARMDRGVIGLDLAGDEAHHPVEKFKAVFDYAQAHHLHITIHAGEAAGPQSMAGAVEVCHAERIGHGVRLSEDPVLERMFQRRKIPLEMCPNSNLLINVVKDLPSYPLARYYHAGIPVTLNTDDRHIFDINLTGEYVAMARHNGLTLAELEDISLTGARVSFLPAARKAALIRRMEKRMAEFEARWRARLGR
ncbi:adenosine deaminase [bacterium]|nr:adenosine deaminase [bacterium]